jgi:hypothetical protein
MYWEKKRSSYSSPDTARERAEKTCIDPYRHSDKMIELIFGN